MPARKPQRVVKGLSLMTLYCADGTGRSYGLYDKALGKTKNDYFLPDVRLMVWLRNIGPVKLFRTR